jgi:divalent metal cation (Fe/Co/Zn/Cd) transporter
VPGDMSVATAHDICDRVEVALKDEMAGLAVTIHVEPPHKAKHQGVLVL